MTLFLNLLFIIFGLLFLALFPRYLKYSDSTYKEKSGISFLQMAFDKGNYGEFLTFRMLEKLEGYNKVFANLYIPKSDGSTTEIDLLLVSETGIYVFESKNYSGWIFGDEKYKNWTSSFPNGKKFKFYNPVWQNIGHINALKEAIILDINEIYKSYIVFSERCTLKKIKITSENLKVLKRNRLEKELSKDLNESYKYLTKESVDNIANIINKYSNASLDIKKAHIAAIKRKYK